jgi:Ca2+-binding RTX toxin-like protein
MASATMHKIDPSKIDLSVLSGAKIESLGEEMIKYNLNKQQVLAIGSTANYIVEGDFYIYGSMKFDSNNNIQNGIITSIVMELRSESGFAAQFTIKNFSVNALYMKSALSSGTLDDILPIIFSGNDSISSTDTPVYGYDGDDKLISMGGSIFGGAGNDRLEGVGATNYLRGDEGDDTVIGGNGFDDINGNMGNDNLSGGAGADWVVGGKDQDLIEGGTGDDVLNGNLGNDTCNGGAGADWVRGGQGDDVLNGGDGNDWMAGDRGSDTITGGAGADTFYYFKDAGPDRITDFSSAQGDRIQLDPGAVYTVSYTTAGVVIDLGADSQLILVGVTQETLGAWLI